MALLCFLSFMVYLDLVNEPELDDEGLFIGFFAQRWEDLLERRPKPKLRVNFFSFFEQTVSFYIALVQKVRSTCAQLTTFWMRSRLLSNSMLKKHLDHVQNSIIRLILFAYTQNFISSLFKYESNKTK